MIYDMIMIYTTDLIFMRNYIKIQIIKKLDKKIEINC